MCDGNSKSQTAEGGSGERQSSSIRPKARITYSTAYHTVIDPTALHPVPTTQICAVVASRLSLCLCWKRLWRWAVQHREVVRAATHHPKPRPVQCPKACMFYPISLRRLPPDKTYHPANNTHHSTSQHITMRQIRSDQISTIRHSMGVHAVGTSNVDRTSSLIDRAYNSLCVSDD